LRAPSSGASRTGRRSGGSTAPLAAHVPFRPDVFSHARVARPHPRWTRPLDLPGRPRPLPVLQRHRPPPPLRVRRRRPRQSGDAAADRALNTHPLTPSLPHPLIPLACLARESAVDAPRRRLVVPGGARGGSVRAGAGSGYVRMGGAVLAGGGAPVCGGSEHAAAVALLRHASLAVQ